ncbi:MAG: Oxidoreductase [Verrucomicrobiaceae bacterium]|nr:Oxidoreductase [Verrucomicrobiaceae bacterium]
MKVGVSGASGQLGTATIKHLLERLPASAIVGISRTPETVAKLGVESRFGDFDKPESLEAAFAGLDKVLIIPTVDLRPGARQIQHSAAIDAAVKAGVGHITFVSAVGTRATLAISDGYFKPEQNLMRTAPQWSILRMAYYIESFAQEAQQSLGHGVLASLSATPVNFVSRDDVAAAAAGILATDGHNGAIYNATGLENFSGDQRAAAVSKAAGKQLPFVQVTREQYAGGLTQAGLPDFIVDAVLAIQDAWGAGAFEVITGDVERLSGKKPRTFADELAKVF